LFSIIFVELRFDPSACGPGLFISDNNTHLRQNVEAGGHRACRAMGNGWTQGIHYFSVRIIDKSTAGYVMIGIVQSTFDTSLLQYVGQTSDSYAFYLHNSHKYNNSASVALTSDLARNGDVIGVLLDLEARMLTYFKNGQILGTAFGQIPLRSTDIKYYPAISFFELGHWVSLIKTTK
jgi:hypothetical protein